MAPTLITKDNLSFFEFFLPDNMLNKIKTKQSQRVDLVVEAEKRKKLEKEHNGGTRNKRKVSDKVRNSLQQIRLGNVLNVKILEATYEVDHVVHYIKEDQMTQII